MIRPLFIGRKMSDSRAIGVFDSGVGGLTVVHEMLSRLPHENIVYFGDTARVPYGSKSANVVRKFALQDARFLTQQDVKLLVVACHTVSSTAMSVLQDHFELPILGVVEPGVVAGLKATRNKRVGVIGTRGTIGSGTYQKKISDQQSDVSLFAQACPLFVPLAEEGWLHNEVARQTSEIYLEPLKKENIDTLILGCTHYPLLKPLLKEVMGPDVRLIDSAEETAIAVAGKLEEGNMANPKTQPGSHQFYVSDTPDRFIEIGETFLNRSLGEVQRVDIDAF